jgi:hypothetical protein
MTSHKAGQSSIKHMILLRLKASMNCLRQRLKKNCSMNSKEEQIVLSSMQTAMFVHTFGHVEIML